MKICSKCETPKPLADFGKSNRFKDGRLARCKQCEHVRIANWRSRNRQTIRDKANNHRLANNESYRVRERAKYRDDPQKAIAASMRYRKRHPTKRHEGDLRLKYGITRADYDQMLAAQGGGCALCGIKPSEQAGRSTHKNVLYVDHDHVTGKVRGLLCNKHNRAIGLFQDDPDALIDAALYLVERSGRIWLPIAA